MAEEPISKEVYKKNLYDTGGSLAVVIPKNFLDELELELGKETEVMMCIDEGKWGKFLAVWSTAQQERKRKEMKEEK